MGELVDSQPIAFIAWGPYPAWSSLFVLQTEWMLYNPKESEQIGG